jgi:hydroxymethylpyrimidine/phosphomethylpyrimidine kinase
MKQALTIAGSDSGGGAGIQADLKTMHAHGVFGTSVITAVTAQNTVEVTEAYELPTSLIKAQMNAVLDDFDIAAAKTGMLSSSDIVKTVSDTLRKREVSKLVVDPVMISKSGYKLLKDDAIRTLTRELLSIALVVTPNLHEAQLLAAMPIGSIEQMKRAARRICEHGCQSVLIKGGHAEFKKATDLLFDGEEFHEFEAEFVDTKNLHGTGCTYSAAITARLALGEPLVDAVGHAKTYISRAIEASLDIGRGHGPTHHFYFLKQDD